MYGVRMNTPMPPPLLLSRKEAARMLSMSTRKLDYIIAQGALVPTRVGKRVYVHADRLKKFAEKDYPELRAPAVPK